jgi:hypothetical protein
MRFFLHLLIAVFVSVTMTACGGEKTPPPSSSAGTPAPAPAKPPAPPEPPKRAPQPAAAVLHGAPDPTEDELGELYDIGRDLAAIAKGEAGAATDLGDDLVRFGPDGMSPATVQALAADVAKALQGKTLDDATMNRLAALLYAVMNADGLNAAQRKALAADLQSTLTKIGAAAPAATAAASHIDRVAAAVTASSK